MLCFGDFEDDEMKTWFEEIGEPVAEGAEK